MDIRNKKVLILGGWGLVGSAVARRIMKDEPGQVILTSLNKEEAHDICSELQKEFNKEDNFFVPWWGNIFVRNEFKDIPREKYLNDPAQRAKFIDDIVNELNDEMLAQSSIYRLLEETKPDIIIDCINTATAIAYQNIYRSYYDVLNVSRGDEKDFDKLKTETEKLICASYVPQLIRHIQIMYNSMLKFKTGFYLKVGTSGTGGMGLNIPFTHSEEKPSRVLLSKSSVAGAHTLLLFLMARTPDGPIVKELKPTASIAWKKIAYGEIKKRNQPIKVYDIGFDNVETLNGSFKRDTGKEFIHKDNLKTVFIDTGENGIFSRGEFETISTLGQMEFITPEEIAEDVVREIKGGNTGHDIINALDTSVMEPSYRAGFLQHTAVNKIKELEKENGTNSVAFEMLGPPRLSKLLFEVHLIRLIYKNFNNYINETPFAVSEKVHSYLKENGSVRNEIVSIGIPILLPDGKSLLRGPEIKIPSPMEGDNISISPENINRWAHEGWVDLREKNWEQWQKRFKDIMSDAENNTEHIHSSRYVFNEDYWDDFNDINIGKVVGWLFIHEEEGLRIKG
jgi:hypothetical protein